jgi:hypothetical protein
MAAEKVGAGPIGLILIVLGGLILLGILFYLAWTEMHPRRQSTWGQNTTMQFADIALGNQPKSKDG